MKDVLAHQDGAVLFARHRSAAGLAFARKALNPLETLYTHGSIFFGLPIAIGGFGAGYDFGNRKKFAIGELNVLGDRRLLLLFETPVFDSVRCLRRGFAVCEVIS